KIEIDIPETNGRPRCLTEWLRGALTGTDEIVIGSPIPGDEKKIQAATMADAARLISGVKFLVRGWIPFSMVTGIVAEPGVGKSAFVLWLVLTIVTAGKWLNGTQGPRKPARVLW